MPKKDKTKYKEKYKVKAEKYTGNDPLRIYNKKKNAEEVVFKHDWIVIDDDGECKKMTPEEFEDKYEA